MAKRVLLLSDDYNERRRLETFLRKLSFDVVAHVNEASLTKELVGFRPDVVLVSGLSTKLSAESVGVKLKNYRNFSGQVILGFPAGYVVAPELLAKMKVDRLIETPLLDEPVLEALCEVLKMDVAVIQAKLKKLNKDITPKTARQNRYAKFLAQGDIKIKGTGLIKSHVRQVWSDSVTEKGIDPEQLKEEKKKFLEILFKKDKPKS
jgi:hypothetical protein